MGILIAEEELQMVDDMSQYRASVAEHDSSAPSMWGAGVVMFAAIMLMMGGGFQVLAGLAAIFENEFFVVTPEYLYKFDATVWGWIHLLLGVVVGLAGWRLLSGQTWARVVGVTVAVLSAITNFLFIPYYPVWSLLVIAIDVLVIWALTVHGRAGAL
jgi:hypothetical protein